MYESCATCTKVGVSCRGPRFENMSANEVITLCKARKAFLGLSNQRIAERANMSKGTVDGLFASAHADFRYETIRPVWNVLFGGDMPDDPCFEMTDGERAAYEEKFRQLEHDMEWQKEKTGIIEKENADLKTLVANTNKRHTDSQNFLRGQIKAKNRTILALSIALSICLLVIIAALIVDRTNSGVGFFWLESLFRPQSFTEKVNISSKISTLFKV